jgi:hypothetical protein
MVMKFKPYKKACYLIDHLRRFTAILVCRSQVLGVKIYLRHLSEGCVVLLIFIFGYSQKGVYPGDAIAWRPFFSELEVKVAVFLAQGLFNRCFNWRQNVDADYCWRSGWFGWWSRGLLLSWYSSARAALYPFLNGRRAWGRKEFISRLCRLVG